MSELRPLHAVMIYFPFPLNGIIFGDAKREKSARPTFLQF